MHQALFTIIILMLSFSLRAQLLITNATVIDIENKKLLPSMDVLVKDALIVDIGKKLKAPAGARIIDGTGKYLIPGFVDTHMHFFQSGGIYTRPDQVDLRKSKPYAEEIAWTHNNMENQLRRYARAGITTVVDVGSTINFLIQRDSFRTKDYAPTIYMTGPLLTTWEPPVYKELGNDGPFYEVKTVEDASSSVQKQLPYKPDFIKIAYLVFGSKKDSVARSYLPLVKAATEEAHKQGLRVAVHAFERLTAQLAVEVGVNHLVHVPFDGPVDAAFIQLLKDKKVVVSSSQIVFDGYRKTFGQNYVPTPEDLHHADPTPLGSISSFKDLPDTALTESLRRSVQASETNSKKNDSLLRVNLKRLVDGGVRVATSTDAGNIGTQHASSYFRELAVMQQSGMNMWQLLESSTINGAYAVGKEAEFGSIQKGKRADMLLLSKNPLDNLANWKEIEWVVIKGVAWKPDIVFNSK